MGGTRKCGLSAVRDPQPQTDLGCLLPVHPSLAGGRGAVGWDAAGLSPRTALVTICAHPPGPVPTTDLWSVSSGTSSVRPITEVCHPENLLMGPFSLNCKQIGKFECDAIRASKRSPTLAAPARVRHASTTCPPASLRAGHVQYLLFLIKLRACAPPFHRCIIKPSLTSCRKFLFTYF